MDLHCSCEHVYCYSKISCTQGTISLYFKLISQELKNSYGRIVCTNQYTKYLY